MKKTRYHLHLPVLLSLIISHICGFVNSRHQLENNNLRRFYVLAQRTFLDFIISRLRAYNIYKILGATIVSAGY